MEQGRLKYIQLLYHNNIKVLLSKYIQKYKNWRPWILIKIASCWVPRRIRCPLSPSFFETVSDRQLVGFPISNGCFHLTTYKDNGNDNRVDAMPICESVSMIMEAAALLVDDMTRTFFFLITNMTRTLYKRKGVVSETSHKAWRQLMLSDIDNLKCSIYPSYA